MRCLPLDFEPGHRETQRQGGREAGRERGREGERQQRAGRHVSGATGAATGPAFARWADVWFHAAIEGTTYVSNVKASVIGTVTSRAAIETATDVPARPDSGRQSPAGVTHIRDVRDI